jgi:DNA-directed RNA polymerase subunit RPC12/RpoP
VAYTGGGIGVCVVCGKKFEKRAHNQIKCGNPRCISKTKQIVCNGCGKKTWVRNDSRDIVQGNVLLQITSHGLTMKKKSATIGRKRYAKSISINVVNVNDILRRKERAAYIVAVIVNKKQVIERSENDLVLRKGSGIVNSAVNRLKHI